MPADASTPRTPVRYNGQLLDIPQPVRHFQRFTSQQRADLRASFRQGYKQRERVGEVFWTHEYVPDRAFPTKTRAIEAAVHAMGGESSHGL